VGGGQQSPTRQRGNRQRPAVAFGPKRAGILRGPPVCERETLARASGSAGGVPKRSAAMQA